MVGTLINNINTVSGYNLDKYGWMEKYKDNYTVIQCVNIQMYGYSMLQSPQIGLSSA